MENVQHTKLKIYFSLGARILHPGAAKRCKKVLAWFFRVNVIMTLKTLVFYGIIEDL